jgi:hypothetical protein
MRVHEDKEGPEGQRCRVDAPSGPCIPLKRAGQHGGESNAAYEPEMIAWNEREDMWCRSLVWAKRVRFLGGSADIVVPLSSKGG